MICRESPFRTGRPWTTPGNRKIWETDQPQATKNGWPKKISIVGWPLDIPENIPVVHGSKDCQKQLYNTSIIVHWSKLPIGHPSILHNTRSDYCGGAPHFFRLTLDGWDSVKNSSVSYRVIDMSTVIKRNISYRVSYIMICGLRDYLSSSFDYLIVNRLIICFMIGFWSFLLLGLKWCFEKALGRGWCEILQRNKPTWCF